MSRDVSFDPAAVVAAPARRDSLIQTARVAGERFRRARGVAALLLAGAASALLVAADQLVSIWADGELMLAWLALWAVVFATYVLFADQLRRWPQSLAEAIDRRMLQYRERAADARLWRVAQSDPRVMAELDAAMLRAETARMVSAPDAVPAQRVALPQDTLHTSPTHRYFTQYY